MNITEISRSGIDVVAVLGPVLAVAAALFLATLAATCRGRRRLRLAARGLRDTHKGSLRQATAGALLPFLAITSLTASLAIEHEIRTGPNRMIMSLTQAAPTEDLQTFWVLQSGTGHLMDTSALPSDSLDDRAPGIIDVSRVSFDLAQVKRTDGETHTGLIVRTAPQRGIPRVSERSDACAPEGQGCHLAPSQAIADAADGYRLGDTIVIRGRDYSIVGLTQDPASLLNRSVVFIGPDPQASNVSGLIVAATSQQAVRNALRSPAGLEVLPTATIQANNATFWAGNGTPILMMLITLIFVFATAALYALRRSEHAATAKTLATLRAIGLTRGQSAQVDIARGLVAALVAVLPGALAAIGLIYVLRLSVLGFHGKLTTLALIAATGVTCAATSAAALLTLARSSRQVVEEPI